MNHKRITKYAAVFATLLALLVAVPAYAPTPPQFPPMPRPPFGRAYPAQINATGELTLKGFGGDLFDLTVNSTFASVVPNAIPPGEYANAEFHGFAAATDTRLRLDGLLNVNGLNFWVAFAVDKPQGISEKMYSANGELHINITQITLPPEKIAEVMMKGNVTKLGDQDAFGFLEAHAKVGARNFTIVHGSFTLQPPPRNIDAAGNFSVSYYAVNLINATKTELDYEGNALYVEGFWNVYNRTVTVTHIDHQEETTVVNIKTLVENASGKFNVTLTPQSSSVLEASRWKVRGNFTLDIQGLTGTIKGNVIFYQTRFADPGDRDIPTCDFNQDHVVNISDISQVAKAFGATLGTPKYDPDADANQDFRINIVDLAVAAQQFGQEY
jgi:hypothetical protein